VSQLPDKLSDPIADLPNPELNPLLNPVLSRHLGQWAHVYFTTAPEKREDALYELLEELKEEEASAGVATAPKGSDSELGEGAYAVVCPHCQRSNVRSQRFCGMCGSLMPIRAQAAAAATGGTFGEALFAHSPDPVASEGSRRAAVTDFSPVPLEREEPIDQHGAFTATSLLFQQEPSRALSAEQGPQPGPVDIDWLRQRNTPAPATSGNLRIATYSLMVAVLVFGSIVLYLHFGRMNARGNPSALRAPAASQTRPAAPTTQSASPATYDALPRSQTTEGQLRSQSEEGLPGARESTFPAEPEVQRQKTAPKLAASTPSDPSQNGAVEVAAAKDYLSGKKGAPDGATAVKLLWRAVGKQNGEALLMLSDLYAAGDGVSKSCEQAHLLLDAALQRNVATADTKFRNLQRSCP
jgi:hypothetical protein